MSAGLIQTATIEISASGNNTIIAGVAGSHITVVGFILNPTVIGANPKFTDGAGGADLTGRVFGTAVWSIFGTRDAPLFRTGRGTALVINQAAAQISAGLVVYYLDAA